MSTFYSIPKSLGEPPKLMEMEPLSPSDGFRISEVAAAALVDLARICSIYGIPSRVIDVKAEVVEEEPKQIGIGDA
jgi:hypothetical protein